MHFQRFAPLGGIVLAGALVLASGAEAAKRDSHTQGTGLHHYKGMHAMLLDDGTGDADEAGSANRDGSYISNGLHYPGELRAAVNDAPAQPYMMAYADEVAQRLGLKAGNFDLISVPSAQGGSFGLSLGGMGKGHSLLNLQWHLGP
jgi:hypothetical protein